MLPKVIFDMVCGNSIAQLRHDGTISNVAFQLVVRHSVPFQPAKSVVRLEELLRRPKLVHGLLQLGIGEIDWLAVKFMVGFWKDAHDEGGLAWDDSSNNRAFLSGTISATNNGASIYLEAKLKPDTYLTEKGTPMQDDTLHAPIPKGLGGQFTLPVTFSNMLMSYSRNQKPAKDFIRWISSKEIFETWFTSQQGFAGGATLHWETDPVWNLDPIMLPFKDVPRTARLAGHAGPPGRASAEALTKYIIVDMYAKAVQGMAPENSVKSAHEELVKIYA